MKWHYICPECGKPTVVDWDKHGKTVICSKTKKRYQCPTPATDHQAYVDTPEWPQEMEDEVYRRKGRRCTVDGCRRRGDTLDHRVPFSKGGKTSVDNLFQCASTITSPKAMKITTNG